MITADIGSSIVTAPMVGSVGDFGGGVTGVGDMGDGGECVSDIEGCSVGMGDIRGDSREIPLS